MSLSVDGKAARNTGKPEDLPGNAEAVVFGGKTGLEPHLCYKDVPALSPLLNGADC